MQQREAVLPAGMTAAALRLPCCGVEAPRGAMLRLAYLLHPCNCTLLRHPGYHKKRPAPCVFPASPPAAPAGDFMAHHKDENLRCSALLLVCEALIHTLMCYTCRL
ncbi:hypothetical protein ABPG77_007849 [Micractinium sp. CCAP 211/92]